MAKLYRLNFGMHTHGAKTYFAEDHADAKGRVTHRKDNLIRSEIDLTKFNEPPINGLVPRPAKFTLVEEAGHQIGQ